MKKIYLLLIVLVVVFFVAFSFTIEVVPKLMSKVNYTKVEVTDTLIYFGIIQHDIPKDTCFSIKNIGDEPLIIQNVETSCGCTVPVWTKKPIGIGEQGQIKITYDAKYPGHFHKTITVYSNIPEGTVQLYIKGEVEYDK